jgi:DnaJ-domain-containing protein 1
VVVDNFALLDRPRRPWLDPASLKERFLALSSAVHPDRVHQASASERQAAQERYTELNGAYQCLRQPKERLQHLLALERGAKPAQVQRIPPRLMDMSLEVAQLCREADQFLARKRATASPLLQVPLFEQGQEWTEKLRALKEQLGSKQAALEAELKGLDAAWPQAMAAGGQRRESALQRLEELYLLMSFFGRWSTQLQERLFELAI